MSAADPRRNLASFLDDLARDPERVAFVGRTAYRRDAWRAGEILSVALHLAQTLRELGVVPGERVLLEGRDAPEWVAGFFGIVAAGAIVVPLEQNSPEQLIRGVVARTSAVAILGSDRALALAANTGGHALRFDELTRRRGLPCPAFEPHRAEPEATAEIVFTSGTTAEPKGVELSHRNLLASLAGIEAGFRKRERWLRPILPLRFLCALPLSHLFGQSLGIFVPIAMRSTSILPATPEPGHLVRWIRTERPLALVTVPRVLASLRFAVLRELERRGRRAAVERKLLAGEGRGFARRVVAGRPVRSVLGWRTWAIVSGGAALDPEVEAFFRGTGFLVIQGYGMSEAAPVIAVQNPLDGSVRTLGRPLKDLEVRIADDGEVLVRGPNVMKGYWNDPEATRAALDDGWLRTGDLAERDAQGRLYFKGRKKDVIVTAGGRNVHPSDLEAALRAEPGVREAVAFALPGSAGDEIGAALLLDPTAASVETIRTAANRHLAAHQAIRRAVAWEEADFPRTATGKIKRREVAAAVRLLDRGAAAARGDAAPKRVAEALARIRGDLAGSADAKARLVQDLGLDSLDVLELVAQIEDETGVAIEEGALSAAATVGDLDRLARAAGPAAPDRLKMPRWNRSAAARLVREAAWTILLRPLLRVFVRIEVRGRENLPEGAGPFLVVANHSSLLDVPAIRAALPWRLRRRLHPAMAVETLPAFFESGKHGVRQTLRSFAAYAIAAGLFGAYPLPQTRGYRPSLEYTGELLDEKLSPLVFPEGRMTRTGAMTPFKAGVGLLAVETRARVLPIHLSGLFELMPPESRWPRRGRARVAVGRPFDPLAAPGGAAEAARRVEQAVRDLAPSS